MQIGAELPEMHNTSRELHNVLVDVVKGKATVQKALDETQLLFDSLMQKYFG